MRIITSIFFLLFCLGTSYSQPVSQFNNQEILVENPQNYSFLVSGHFHGSSQNKSGFPASTLLANIDNINELDPAFIISLGDIFKDIRKETGNYQWALFDQLSAPIYNAVGNHDVSGDIYQKKYGETWFSFSVGSQLFIILDTETDGGNIENEQLDFLKKEINNANSNIRQIFIFAHRLIWAEEHPELKDIFTDNTRSSGGNNFQEDIVPLIKSANAKVYWFGGSMGGMAPASFFYHPDDISGVVFIATAIRNLPRDAVLEVDVNNGNISFNTISLTGQKLNNIQQYNLDYFKKHYGKEPFNWRLLPLYVFQTFTHRYFWYGVLLTLSGIGLIYLFLRWRRKKLS